MAINTTLKSNDQDIWLCKKLTSTTWGEPVKYRANVMPTNSDGEIFAYGVSFPQFLRIKASPSFANLFKAGDRVYFRKDLPSEHDDNQTKTSGCNFEVNANPSVSLNVGDIRLKYLVGK